jgi:hypothetical protein
MHPVEAGNCGAAAARLALIAGCCGVVKVVTAGALQKIAAGRGHVAQLRRRARQDRAREYRITSRDQRVIGEVGIWHEGSDPHSARCFLNDLERQARNIDQPGRAFDILLHQIDQVGAAGDEFRPGSVGDLPHRIGDVAGPRVLEIDHACSIACWMAATMFG